MNRFYFIWILFFYFLMSFNNLFSQDIIPLKVDDSEIQQQLEGVAETTTNEENDYTNLLEDLIYFKTHPINLNKTNAEELQQLHLLNDIQINALLNHIKKSGSLIIIYELQTVKGFDKQTIDKILPYVYVSDIFNQPSFSIREMFNKGQSVLILRAGKTLEQQKGFLPIDSSSLFNSPNSRYIGSPERFYARYNFNYNNNVSWGITTEKDQGELFFKKNQRYKYNWYTNSLNGNQHSGFDFYSAHFFVKDLGVFKKLAIGDYQVSFGQGLTAWTGLAFGKSFDIISIKRSASGVRPYKSVDENRFLRGAATTFYYKHFEVTTFVSHKKIDATVSDTLIDESVNISTLQETGYHATVSEIANKHSVTQTVLGSNFSYKNQQFSLGLTAIKLQLDKNLIRNLSPYNQFEFSSKQNFNIGIDYNYILKNFNFFGEQAIGNNGGMAFVNGVLVYLEERVYLTALYRNYDRNYQNLLSNGFSQNTINANEKGFYLGISIKPIPTLAFTAYYDRFEFPWLKYLVNAPSYGNDYMTQLTFTPSKKLSMYIRMHTYNKQKNTSNDTVVVKYIVPVTQSNYRLNISYSILPAIKLVNRIELVDYKLDNLKTQKGYLIFQDVVYNKLGFPLSITLRYALFHTFSYDARIYAYESDFYGSYSIPSFYSRGSRFYTMINYNITKKIEIWLRYSQTFYDDKKVISEGSLNEIEGNTKSEIKAQLVFKF